VLGAAAGGGFPQWNCRCGNCELARRGGARARTQSSVAVGVDGGAWLLLNASPDLRAQLAATPALWPRDGLRDSPVAAVVPTNGDVDHVGGLLSLREDQPFTLAATPRVLAAIDANPIFSVLAPGVVERRPLELDRPFRVGPIEIVPFAVPGKVPLYLEGQGTEAEDVVGLEVRTGRRRFHYVPGCAAVTPQLAARLRGSPLVLFDGTLWRDDEMIAAGTGSKTGRRMGHISMSGPDGAMAALAELGIGRKVFVHVNNTNPAILDDSPERRELEAAGWEVAFDGMEPAPWR